MARKRNHSRRNHSRGRVVLATVLTVALLCVLGATLTATLRELRIRREAEAAGVQNYSQEIPRNSYQAEKFREESGRVTYEDEAVYTMSGIDVSVHQGVIDWQAVAADGVDFAILQAGYRGYSDGDLGEDEQFRANFAGARAAGIPIGVYFFSQATTEEEAREEARFTLELLQGETLEHPVFFDWERVDAEGVRTEAVTGDMVTAFAEAFCETIEAEGYEAGIYFNQNDVYTLVDLSKLLDYPLWMAQYRTVPDFFYDFSYWQYTDQGSISGIAAPVDLNVCFVSKEESSD